MLYVVAGSATILVGEERKAYRASAAVVVPRMTVHGYWNDSDEPIKLLITFCPALDHDQFFKGLAELKRGPRETYAENLANLRRRFGSVSVTE